MKTNASSRSAFFTPRVALSFASCSAGVVLGFLALSNSTSGNNTVAGLSKGEGATHQAPGTAAPQSGTWTPTGSMGIARRDFTATLLTNGKVLVAGGSTPTGTTASAELYDPATGQWTGTGSMTIGRVGHTATLLADGRVLIAGGDLFGLSLASAELYDPNTETWTLTGKMTIPRVGHMARLITTGPLYGMVLAAGGSDTCFFCLPPVASAEIFDPGTGTWTTTRSMTMTRLWSPPPPIAVLQDGSILVVGGVTCCPFLWINEAESYSPIDRRWTATSAKATDANAEPILLPDGKVLVAGGVQGDLSGVFVADAELFDSATGVWTATTSMSTDRGFPTLTLLTNGKVLVAGGPSGALTGCNDIKSAELYDPATGQWTSTGSMTTARYQHTATLLPNGQVLAAGGRNCARNPLASAELYTPETTVPKHLVLWNTLGSDFEVENSAVGLPLLPLQTLTYENARFGSGILSDNAIPVVQIPEAAFSVNEGSITLWVRIVSISDSFLNGQALDFINVATSQHSNLQLEYTANDGLGHSGWGAKLWDGQYVVYSFDEFGTVSTKPLGSNGEDVFIALRWNRDGVPGHGTEKLVISRNLQKSGRFYDESDGAVWGNDFQSDATMNLKFGVNVGLIYDDLKIFNKSITDGEVRQLYQGRFQEQTPPRNSPSRWSSNAFHLHRNYDPSRIRDH